MTACAVFALWLIGRSMSGFDQDLALTPQQLEYAAEAEASRNTEFTKADLYSLVSDKIVEPKGEPPLLAPLVENGDLPPVQQRLPEHPLVLKGVDGIGNYGGTWLRVATNDGDVGVITNRMSYAVPMRWSPLGEPLVPHVAESITTDDDGKTWTMTLRKGHRWSDGEIFDADDVMFWWQWDVLDTTIGDGAMPWWISIHGQGPQVTKVDQQTVTFAFPEPNGLFREFLATYGSIMFEMPAHYLKRYHPSTGDAAFLAKEMKAYALPSARSLYGFVRSWENPEHPRLWPWIYRSHRSNPPYVFVRNPYYFVVDEAGNQLPYLDRLQFDVRREDQLPLDIGSGRVSMQERNLQFTDYPEYMSRRDVANIDVLNWHYASRSVWQIQPNLNRKAQHDTPIEKWKEQFLPDKRLRQALSLAINRQRIIDGEYSGVGEPMQVRPGPGSAFDMPEMAYRYTEFDPARAQAMLDELGLKRPKPGAFRTFPDGTPMVFYLDYTPFTGRGPADFVVEDWANVGVRSVARERARSLMMLELHGNAVDMLIWTAESEFFPLLSPRSFVPWTDQSFWAQEYGQWHSLGGPYNSESSRTRPTITGPPKDSPVAKVIELYGQAVGTTNLGEQVKLFREIYDIASEQVWTINIASPPPQIVVKRKSFKNVPQKAMVGWLFLTPGNAGLETYFDQAASDSPGATEQSRQQILNADPRPRPGDLSTGASKGGTTPGRWIYRILIAASCLFVLMVGVRHPFIGKRLLIMIPTMLILSVMIFTIIQLPPGDFLTSKLADLQAQGSLNMEAQIEDLRSLYHFEDPVWKRYLRWMGVFWFGTFDTADAGLLQFNLGRSMTSSQPVNLILGDRLLLTVLISAGTILFTWVVAMPIGIYSAVRQYTTGDYIFTIIGFVGMAVPNFLLALVLMALAGVSGLFSAEFATQPEWNLAKVLDLLKHIWIPVVVIGTGGTAGMIRVMRANLLDELRKPYVTTARAKGVTPLKLLIKYPVRLALNPFISGIGGIFPALVSGSAIVAMVLALPTIGPLLLESLFMEDMYMAGSMLMTLSLLGIVGTLVSDLLLLWLDPRIRYEGGSR